MNKGMIFDNQNIDCERKISPIYLRKSRYLNSAIEGVDIIFNSVL